MTDHGLDEAHDPQLDEPHPAHLARQGLQESLDLRDGGGPAAAARAETLDPVGMLLAIFTAISAPDGPDR